MIVDFHDKKIWYYERDVISSFTIRYWNAYWPESRLWRPSGMPEPIIFFEAYTPPALQALPSWNVTEVFSQLIPILKLGFE